MKRNNNNHNIHASSVNDMPDIEIVDLENDTMQDTDSGNFHSGILVPVLCTISIPIPMTT